MSTPVARTAVWTLRHDPRWLAPDGDAWYGARSLLAGVPMPAPRDWRQTLRLSWRQARWLLSFLGTGRLRPPREFRRQGGVYALWPVKPRHRAR